MKIPCSNCNQRLEIPDELAGQTIECPSCNASLAVPPPAPAQVQESAPQAASSKKSKLSIPKWAIASVAGIAVVVVGLIMFFPDDSNGVLPSEPTAVKTDGESQQSSPPAEAKPVEPVAEAAQPEPPTAKAPDISIHDAARTGNIEAVKQHLAAGTDVNAKNNVGWTPLDLAILMNEKEIADLLRKHGGKTGEELKAAGKPTEPVAEASQPEPTTAKAPDISIRVAARTGNIEAVKQHLAAGADVDVKGDFGTPLHYAMMYGRRDVDALLEVVELLIAGGADVNAKNDGGWTPLHGATSQGHKEVVELLIDKGADVNAKSDDGRTPLDRAIAFEHSETADLLRKHGGKTGEELKAEGK
jgi:ankyrin repeat protein